MISSVGTRDVIAGMATPSPTMPPSTTVAPAMNWRRLISSGVWGPLGSLDVPLIAVSFILERAVRGCSTRFGAAVLYALRDACSRRRGRRSLLHPFAQLQKTQCDA